MADTQTNPQDVAQTPILIPAVNLLLKKQSLVY